MEKYKKPLFTALKIGVSIIFLYVVYTQVPFQKVWGIYKNANWGFLVLAVLSFIFSQFLSSRRLLKYFHLMGYSLSDIQNQRLYLIGMFYNFFIPGGVGGDAYKVYFLHKTYGWSAKKLGKAVFVDRLMGLGVITILCVSLLSILNTIPMIWRVVAAVLAIFGIGFSYFLMKKIDKSYLPIWSSVMLYSFFIQGCQLLCVAFILLALGVETHYLAYFIGFLLSSILGIFSMGGIGVREYVFLQMSNYLNVNEYTSVAIGMMFTLITAFVSLGGLYYHLNEKKYFPLKKT